MGKVPRVLTVAGSDCSGGAGIQADLKTFTALGVYGMSALTAVTVQNTGGVLEVHTLPPELVYRQIEAVVRDMGVDAVKVGMLWKGEVVESVALAVERFGLDKLILDPLIRATDGTPLISEEGLGILRDRLLPRALLLTPNAPEAGELCGIEVRNPEDMEECARDGRTGFRYLVGERIRVGCVRGTGCTFSAAVAAYVAKGYELAESVRRAKEFVREVIRRSFSLGRGCRSPNHLWRTGECAADPSRRSLFSPAWLSALPLHDGPCDTAPRGASGLQELQERASLWLPASASPSDSSSAGLLRGMGA